MALTASLYFDSCTHPTLNGEWTRGQRGIGFQDLASIRLEIPNYHALAIGLPGIGSYEHSAFKRECDTWGFEAIAAITTLEPLKTEREFETISKLGFRGIKIHPRLLGSNRDLTYLSRLFSLCDEFGLVCLLCTYEADAPGQMPTTDPFYQICAALNDVPSVRLILMHGGGSRLLQFAALSRHSETILIDLSFTIIDEMTRALDPSIRDLMTKLDHRICVGSDSPESDILQVFQRIQDIAFTLDAQKRKNILSANLERFFPILRR